MSDLTFAPAHTCDAICWDYIVRTGEGQVPECDPFAARAASDAEAAAEGAFAFPHEY
jgi:hypothetical protein